MNLIQMLDLWGKACYKAQLPWSLYKDTLLCVSGYHSLPAELSCLQVAITSNDLSRAVELVVPELPDDWELAKGELFSANPQLCFKKDGRIILSIHLLHNAESLEAFLGMVKPYKAMYGSVVLRYKLAKMVLELLGKGINKAVRERLHAALERKVDKAADRAFEEIKSIATKYRVGMTKYFDLLAIEPGEGIDSLLLSDFQMISIYDEDGIEWQFPVFSGYQTLLEDSYGDYHQGLYDDIGCGLTADEKVELKAHQARCREALAYVQRISRKHNLRYYLLAGSVLGAVRHEGFIPWDDDVDIGIRIEEVDAFEEAILRELPEGFTLERSAPNHPYPRMFSKICYQGRCCIDFWPLVPTHVDGFKAVYTWYFGKIITKAHYQKIGYKVNAFLKIVKVMDLILNDRQVMWLARRNERRYAGKQTPAYINLYSIYTRQKETILRQWLDTEATAMFEGIEVPIVGCTDAYLTHLYGDYMAFPPRWKRASRHVERF